MRARTGARMESQTIWPSLRAYHDMSSSPIRSPSVSASSNSGPVAEARVSATTCHSLSSDVSGVVEMPLLKQADMLVSEGVGEGVRARGEVFSR